jgi:hypothetical protein
MKSFARFLYILSWTTFCVACGGGGGGTTAPPAVPTNAGGIWDGTSTAGGQTIALTGVVTENGEGRFFDDNGTQYIVSSMSGNDGSITMNVMAVAQFGFVFEDGSTVTTGTLSGTIVERASFNGDWSLATGESGTLSMTYDPLYERDSSLSKLEGMWGENSFGITIFDPDGSFFEEDIFGCVFNGQTSIIDPDYNVYEMNMTISLCGPEFDGQYSGLAVLTDFNTTDDMLIVQMNSDDLIFTTSLLRL